MDTQDKTTNKEVTEVQTPKAPEGQDTSSSSSGPLPTSPGNAKRPRSFRDGGGARGGRGGGRGAGGRRPSRGGHERARPEFEHKVINVRRVTRVVAGGRRFSFSVALVAGDRKGAVGVGIGKAGDTALAIEKAMRSAKKNMVKLHLTKSMSIPHDVKAKFSSARILIMPARGRGIVAGSSVRNVLHLAGIKDVSAKILSGSKNKLNIARVAVQALSTFADRKADHQERASVASKVSEASGAPETRS